MATQCLKVIIADDHPLFGVALRYGLQRLDPDIVVIEVACFADLHSAVHQHDDINLVVLDLMMPDVEGLSALQFLRSEFPQLRVVIISAAPERTWIRAAEALGAVGFIPKASSAALTQKILHTLLHGGSWWPDAQQAPANPAPCDEIDHRIDRLSRQELRILLQIKSGRLNKQIAFELGIAESTVKTHISTILRKLDLQTRTQAAVLVERLMSNNSAAHQVTTHPSAPTLPTD